MSLNNELTTPEVFDYPKTLKNDVYVDNTRLLCNHIRRSTVLIDNVWFTINRSNITTCF